MYLIDMIMAPNQMVQKDASNNCYFISQIKGIVKDTLNGLDDSVGVAFLTYYQPPDSPSITVLMSRQDALVYVDTLAGNTPMYNGANEMVAINLLEKMAYITELVHFVPCAPMKTGMSDTAGLFSKASLQKLILISSDLTEDQVKNNYALSDSKDPTLIVDMNFPPENILQYLKNNLPPIPPTTTTTATPSPSSTYNVTFSMYLIDMIMDPNQMLQKDASYNCYFISQMKGIVKDTLNGLDDSVGVAFLTYYQPPDSPSITVLMSRQDALVYVDTLAGNTPMYNGANEMAAMSLFDKTNYVSELVHFVPCEPMRMDGASGLFSSTSLEKLVLISSDLNQDQIISNYNLPNDSRYSTLILDKDVPKENISNNLEHNLPPDVATTPSTEQNPQLYHIMSPTTTITTTPVPLIPCQALFIADASDAVSSIRQEAIISQVSAQNLFNDPTLQFTAAVWSYGDYSQIGDLPESFVNTTVDFNALSDALYKTGGTDDVKFAATKVNAWDKTNTVIVLFTASPQSAINDASKTYQRFSATVGISTTANDMSPLAAFTVDFSNPAGIPVAIRQTCVNLLSATTTTAESTTTAGSTTIGTTGTGDSCNVLFVVDGSSYWNSFRGEIVSISTVANILYSTTNFTSNFWMYGDDPQDDRIPTSFYSTEQDFLDDIQELSTYGGKETVVGATSKLNDWQTYALIVIYTASSQTLINVAGANYTEQSRTVAIHQNDGIDLRPISNYPSYEISNYTNIVDVITNACKHFPMKTTTPKTQPTTTTTLKASTSTSARPQSTVSPSLPSSTTTAPFAETTSTYSTESVPSTELFSSTSPELASTTTPIPPPCPVFFYIDGSAAKTVIDQQINLTETVASSMYQSYEWRFLSSVSAFGQLIIGDPDPNTLIDNFPAFEATLDLLDFSSPSGDVTSAIDTMNGDSDFGNVLTILFVAAPQPRIDGANANLYKDFTYGIGMIGKQNLTRLSYDSDDYTTDNGTTLQQAINNFCANFPAMAPSPQTVPTVSLTTSTTTPIPIVKTLFVIDGSSLAGSIVSQRLFLQSLARVAFGRMDMVFSANIWEYGDDSKDEAIPITFIDNLNDVDDAITFQQSYGGKENIIGATGKLNDWPIFDGVIVLITASPDNLIDMVSYFKRNQTVAMSTHDGVEMSAITDYPHTISSPYADVLDDIRKVALNLAPSTTVLTGSTRTGPTTIGSSFVVKRLTDYGHLIRKPRHTYDTCTQPTYGLHRIRRQNFLDP
ncbi:unnamed protein product, partial [Mesorhabditis belari]|uniref:Uncharacterized protein n=1 Tax=Mesorhabditis belari TaxID=2138241 RepID=A0AAF3EK63_9BILA